MYYPKTTSFTGFAFPKLPTAVATKTSIIELHVKSLKHERCKKRLSLNAQREADIKAVETFDKECHTEGENLPSSIRVYRIKVVSAMLKAGVPLSKIEIFLKSMHLLLPLQLTRVAIHSSRRDKASEERDL